jgi:hypothetical protein
LGALRVPFREHESRCGDERPWTRKGRQQDTACACWGIIARRFEKDTLFKAIQYYVEPKIRGEEGRLRELVAQLEAMKDALPCRERTRLEKTIEAQHELLNELASFKEALQRVVALGYDPDLNDGVVLNIAPLYELVPWREAKKYWDDLCAGKYTWSTISQRLHAKALHRG